MATISSALNLIDGDTDPVAPTGPGETLFYIKGGQLFSRAVAGAPIPLLGANSGLILTAGNGLTGGGDLTANRTFNVANADGTLNVTADDVKVGTLLASNIPDGLITNAKRADSPANTFKGRVSSTGPEQDLTVTQSKTLLNLQNTDIGGLGTLATQNGTFSGTSSGTNTGDQSNIVNATLADMPDATFKMRTGGVGKPIDGTIAQAKTSLAIAFADVSGLGSAATQPSSAFEVANAVANHVAAADPHPVYLTAAEGNSAYQPLDADLTNIAAVANQTAYGQAFLRRVAPPNSSYPATAIGVAATKVGSWPLLANQPQSGTRLRLKCVLTNTATLQTLTPTFRFGPLDTAVDPDVANSSALGAGTAAVGGCTIIYEIEFLNTTQVLAYWICSNHNGVAGITNTQTQARGSTALVNVVTNVATFIGVYFLSSVNAICTARILSFEFVTP